MFTTLFKLFSTLNTLSMEFYLAMLVVLEFIIMQNTFNNKDDKLKAFSMYQKYQHIKDMAEEIVKCVVMYGIDAQGKLTQTYEDVRLGLFENSGIITKQTVKVKMNSHNKFQ